jgi:hypothetical protein
MGVRGRKTNTATRPGPPALSFPFRAILPTPLSSRLCTHLEPPRLIRWKNALQAGILPPQFLHHSVFTCPPSSPTSVACLSDPSLPLVRHHHVSQDHPSSQRRARERRSWLVCPLVSVSAHHSLTPPQVEVLPYLQLCLLPRLRPRLLWQSARDQRRPGGFWDWLWHACSSRVRDLLLHH